MQKTPELQSLQGGLKTSDLGGDNNALAARAASGLSGGSHSSTSNHSYSTNNENQLADTFLPNLIPILGFSLAWESTGNSHISKNFLIAFRNAACCIPLRNAFPFAQHKQAQAWARLSETLCSSVKWILLHMPLFLRMNFDFSASSSTF